MKLDERLLLHTIDATTPNGLPPRAVGAALSLIFRACIYLAVFVLGMAFGAR